MEKTLEQFDFESSNIIQKSSQIQIPHDKMLQIDATDVERDKFLWHICLGFEVHLWPEIAIF